MSSSLDHPRTGKSISIALAFALRACVRAKLCGCETIRLWLGAARFHDPGVPPPPSGPLCVASQNHSLVLRGPANRCKSLLIDSKSFPVASRCFSLLPAAFPLLPAAFRLKKMQIYASGHRPR